MAEQPRTYTEAEMMASYFAGSKDSRARGIFRTESFQDWHASYLRNLADIERRAREAEEADVQERVDAMQAERGPRIERMLEALNTDEETGPPSFRRRMDQQIALARRDEKPPIDVPDGYSHDALTKAVLDEIDATPDSALFNA